MNFSDIAAKVYNLYGDWYNNINYYKYAMHRRPAWQRYVVRFLLLPVALFIRFADSLQHRVEIQQVEMLITTRCNLRCRDCANLIPFYKNPHDIKLESLKREVDDFLANVNRVQHFAIMGGETFLYGELKGLLEHLLLQKKIQLLLIVTNGSIKPHPDLYPLLKNRKILVTISNYPVEIVPEQNDLISIFKQNHINYIRNNGFWRDYGGLNPEVEVYEDSLKYRFSNCKTKRCHNIFDGEFYLCPRSLHGWQTDQFPKSQTESISYRGKSDPKAFAQNLQLLKSEKYLTACSKCKGFEGDCHLPPAVQI